MQGAGHHCCSRLAASQMPMAVARGNEKGRVERSIRYIRDNFFAARVFTDVADLNAQAKAWTEGPAFDRPWPEGAQLTVRQAFEAESPSLMALPLDTYDGPVPPSQLDYYRDEFAFRFNRSKSASRGLLFYRLLLQAVVTEPVTYEQVAIGC